MSVAFLLSASSRVCRHHGSSPESQKACNKRISQSITDHTEKRKWMTHNARLLESLEDCRPCRALTIVKYRLRDKPEMVAMNRCPPQTSEALLQFTLRAAREARVIVQGRLHVVAHGLVAPPRRCRDCRQQRRPSSLRPAIARSRHACRIDGAT